MESIIGLKELREHTEKYIKAINAGKSFIVVRKSRPVFKISSSDDEPQLWERAVDFTKIKKGGVALPDVAQRL